MKDTQSRLLGSRYSFPIIIENIGKFKFGIPCVCTKEVQNAKSNNIMVIELTNQFVVKLYNCLQMDT